MSKIFTLKGKIQNYLWGGRDYIPDLLSIDSNEDRYAEYWLGAHANAPSIVVNGDREGKLDTFLNDDLPKYLGDQVAKRFGRLPFLFKVLDVHDMLSIQVHPSKEEAEKGYAKENELGISPSAPNRNYKDDNHKPEIMVALSEFWLLHGFLSGSKLKRVLLDTPEFADLISVFETEGYRGLYKHVMEQSTVSSDQVLRPLIDRVMPAYKAGGLDKSSPDYWAAKSADSAGDSVLDKGIYSIYFFNIVKVNKGEAIFQDAGIPHAYLEGQNMELMANSDNVLRGGLTPKHIDVPELLKHVVFEETIPKVMSGELQSDGVERIYRSPAPDFELSQIDIDSSKPYQAKTQTVQVFMVLEGSALISESDDEIKLTKGDAVLVLADADYQIATQDHARLYKATTPL